MTAEALGPAEGTVKSVAKVLDILEHLGAAGGPVSLSDLARATSLHVSTAHRLLQTLAQRGYVEQRRASRRYALGPGIVALGGAFLAGHDLVSAAQPIVAALRDALCETIHLGVYSDGAVLDVCNAGSPQPVGASLRTGRRDPAHCTAIGKLLLAQLPTADLDRFLAARPLERMTRRSIVDPEGLRAAIDRARADDHALDEGELADGLSCVGVPVRDRAGRVVAGLSVAMPSDRFRTDRLPDWLTALRAAAADIGRRLDA
ncbi:MAG: IclR family transcriptional regulator [Alphaproteobacteria bacterium]